jgi:hypothetical protein
MTAFETRLPSIARRPMSIALTPHLDSGGRRPSTCRFFRRADQPTTTEAASAISSARPSADVPERVVRSGGRSDMGDLGASQLHGGDRLAEHV